MLEVKNISKSYDNNKAVSNLSFTVKEGEIFGLLGVNGAGKTTTFRMINNLLKPDSGEILLDGKKIDYSVTDEIGYLTEERSLLTKMKVKEQIEYYGALKSIPKDECDKRLDYLLKLLNISEYKDSYIKELSKGNQQKIQFISAIINKPKLLILDEPFTGLDPYNVELIIKIIKDMTKNGTIIIFSSHRMEQVEKFCEKILILVKGNRVLYGNLNEIKKKYLKKSIHVIGDIDVNKIKKIDGVNSVSKLETEYIINIDDISVSNNVFNAISDCKDIIKYEVEDPSLNDIFVNLVGDIYE